MAINFDQLNQIYLAYFGRPVDYAGYSFYTHANATPHDVAAAFASSAESQALYGGDVSAMVSAIYRNLFNREPEAAGLSYWTGQITSGAFSAPQAALVILQAAVSSDATAIANKLSAAAAFFAAIDTDQERSGYAGSDAAASARAFVATVSADPASLVAARLGADSALAAAAGTAAPAPATTLTVGPTGGVYDNIGGSKVVVTVPADLPPLDVTLRFAEDDVALTLNLGRDDPSPAGEHAVRSAMNLTTATLSNAPGDSLNGVASLTINSAGVTKAQVANGHFYNQNVVVWDAADDLASLTMVGDSSTTLMIKSGGKLTLIDVTALSADVNLGGTSPAVAQSGVTIKGGQGSMITDGSPAHDTILFGTGGGTFAGEGGDDSITIAPNATGRTTLLYSEGPSAAGRIFPHTFDTVLGFVNYATGSAAGDLSDALVFQTGSGVLGVPPAGAVVLEDTLVPTPLGGSGIYFTSHAGVVQFLPPDGQLSLTPNTLVQALEAGLPANRTAAFESGGSTYVVHASFVTPGTATDAAVELVGVTGITALSADGTAGLHTLLVGRAPV